MSLDREIEALASERERSLAARAKRKWRALVARRKLVAYRRVFFDDHGKLRDEAAVVLADIGKLAGLGRVRVGMGHDEILIDSGRRHVALHIIDWLDLDGIKAAEIAKQLRETSRT